MAKDNERLGMVTLRNVRLSYPNIFKPGKEMKGSDGKPQPGKFGATFIIDPTTAQGKKTLAQLKAAKEAVMEDKWGSKPPRLGADRICTKKYKPVEDEDGEIDEDSIRPEYDGMYLVSARAKDKPSIIDINKGGDGKWRRLIESDGKPYGGCYVNAIIRLWAQASEDYGNRVNASLEVVQFYKNGESFGAGPINPDDVMDDDLAEGGDLDDLDSYGEGEAPDDDGDSDLV